MAIVKLSPFLIDLRGKLGGYVYFRRFRGRLVMSKLPVFTKPPSEKQLAQRQAFMEAMAFARETMKDPEQAAYYRELASKRGISPIAVAVGDYLRRRKLEAVEKEKPRMKEADARQVYPTTCRKVSCFRSLSQPGCLKRKDVVREKIPCRSSFSVKSDIVSIAMGQSPNVYHCRHPAGAGRSLYFSRNNLPCQRHD